MKSVMHAMHAVRSVFFPTSRPVVESQLEADTQAIIASSESIKRRADEFSRLIHGMRMDKIKPIRKSSKRAK